MKQIAIFTSETATTEELAAAYALADYLTNHTEATIEIAGKQHRSIQAAVVSTDKDNLSFEANQLQRRYRSLIEQNETDSNYASIDLKIALGVKHFSEFEKEKGAFWNEWMQAETKFLFPGKRSLQPSKRFRLPQMDRMRNSCVEMVYDYITADSRVGLRSGAVARLLYLGLFSYTKNFTTNLSPDTFQMLDKIVTAMHPMDMNLLGEIQNTLSTPTLYSAVDYGKMLAGSHETKNALLCTTPLRTIEDGLTILSHLRDDFEKPVILLHGKVHVAPYAGKTVVFAYAKKELFSDIWRHPILTRPIKEDLSMEPPRIPHGMDGVAYGFVNEAPERVEEILSEKIMTPSAKSVDLMKATLL